MTNIGSEISHNYIMIGRASKRQATHTQEKLTKALFPQTPENSRDKWNEWKAFLDTGFEVLLFIFAAIHGILACASHF